MTLLMGIGLVLFITWAALFEIDQTVRASGQLIPSARTQVIQVADGGVLGEILAQEGQTVQAGARVAVLERMRPTAALEEGRSRGLAMAAALERAQAEASGRAPAFGKRFDDFPQFAQTQQALYDQRKRTLEQDVATLNEALALARDELRMTQSLLDTGDISRLELMRAKRQVSELQGRIVATRNRYLQEARLEASRLAEEIASNQFKLDERQNVLDHTVITAPVAGIVKYLKVTTVGGVLRPGDELMQISPTDGGLLVELRLNPVDIGQLSLGLPASIKLDAYDYSVHGALHGKLTYLSSDTLSEQGPGGQISTYYRAHVLIDPPQAPHKLAEAKLKPGMTATVDIKTDSRSVLGYLAKPITRAFQGAMNER